MARLNAWAAEFAIVIPSTVTLYGSEETLCRQHQRKHKHNRTFDSNRLKFPTILRGVRSEAMMRQSVTRESPVSINVNVFSVPVGILVLRQSPVHHGVPGDVVAPVCVESEGQPDVVETRQEVESVPGSLSGSLLAGTDLEHSGVLQGGGGEERVGEDGDGVDGRTVIETTVVRQSPRVLGAELSTSMSRTVARRCYASNFMP